MIVTPTLEVENDFFAAGHSLVLACDEVGRGAIAGPVTVGMVAINAHAPEMPEGLRDSKLLSEKRRVALAPRATEWAHAWAVGEASAREVDEVGIIAALTLAGTRALDNVHRALAWQTPPPLLLDGSHDWLTESIGGRALVTTRVKADRDCASVAAASVIAKVHRDTGMHAAHDVYPVYGWASNKGYGSAAHQAAIAEHGVTNLHRRTWIAPRA